MVSYLSNWYLQCFGDIFLCDIIFLENDNSLILKIKNKAQLDKIDKEIRESENSDVVVSAIKDIGEYTPKFESADNNSDYKVLDFAFALSTIFTSIGFEKLLFS